MFNASRYVARPGTAGPRWLPRHGARPLVTVLTGLALALPACSEKHPPAEPEEPVSGVFDLDNIDWQSRVPPEDRGTRYGAPWYWLTDAELSAAVAAANGRVAIGFKDRDERGGVEHGRVICSPGSEAAGKQFLRDLGLEFEFEFETMPTVLLTMPLDRVPTLVSVIRASPLIDYLEPMLPGEWAG